MIIIIIMFVALGAGVDERLTKPRGHRMLDITSWCRHNLAVVTPQECCSAFE